jgi:hypothetical protein
MCLDAGIVRPAEIADQIVSHRGDVNSLPTLAQHNLDQTSPLSFWIAITSVPLGTVARAQAQGRNCMERKEKAKDAPSDDASA